jgi:glycosyltransferase involved in cell wall biosynthesis
MSLRVMFFLETPHRLAGSQRSLMAALTRIRGHGIDPLVVFPGPGQVEEAYRTAGIPTRIVEAPPSLLLFNKRLLGLGARRGIEMLVREQIPYVRTLAALIRDEGFDVVHFNTPRGILVGGAAAKLTGRPVVLHLRGAPEGFHRAFWVVAQILADRIVMVARALEQTIYPPFRRRCTVVYNGVLEQPARDRMASRAALAVRIGRPELAASSDALFVSLSSFTPFKGLHHLLAAAAAARDRGVRAHYVLAGTSGEGWYQDHVLQRRSELGLEDIVHLLGFVPDPLSVLAAADAVVLPSVHHEWLEVDGVPHEVHGTEGLPRSILEALSLGVPVIATDVQGVAEQVDDGDSGLVVPPSDPAALAAAIVRAAADPAWRERAGERGRAIARSRFTIDGAAAGLASVLHSLRR